MAVSQDPEALFEPAFLRQLEALSLAARQIVRGSMKADRRSSQHGASVEFAEYRAFVEGDDYRYIDWHAFARWRQLVMKLFVEEEDLHVHVLIDCTRSMDWGEPNKFDYARQIGAGLVYMALANLDRAGVALIGSQNVRIWPASRGKEKFLPMLRFLARSGIEKNSLPLETAVIRWLATQPKRGLVILVGDLWGASLEDSFQALDRLRYARQEIALIQVIDPSEKTAGPMGEYDLRDADYGSRLHAIVDNASRKRYETAFQSYQERLSSYCKRSHISLLQAEVTTPVQELLLRSLRSGGFVR